MGCLCPARATSPQEALLVRMETDMELSSFSANHLVACASRGSSEGLVSVHYLTQARVGITQRKLNDTTDPCFHVFSKLMVDGCFETDKLVALFVLVGSGPALAKASLLFTHYSKAVKGLLSRREAKQMLQDLTYVTLKSLPLLATGDRFYSSIYRYIAGLAPIAYDLVASALELMYREANQLSLEEFLEKFVVIHDGAWICPHSLRMYLAEFTQASEARRRPTTFNQSLESIAEVDHRMEKTLSEK